MTVHRSVHTDHGSVSTRDTTSTLGQAFDMACALLGHTPQPTAVREAIAKRILEAAKAGTRSGCPARRRTGRVEHNSNEARARSDGYRPKVSESDD
jgi:hypothetical protein